MNAVLGRAFTLTFIIGTLVAGNAVPAAPQPPPYAGLAPTVISGAGDITAVVELYRSLLGPNNGGEPGSRATGRREINWDGVPDDLSAPNFLPPDFFNDVAAPRARGAFFSTPGAGVQVSANSDNAFGAAVRFGNINPNYVDRFETFSPERLFSPIDSNIVDMTFFVPGTSAPAVVNGFGAVSPAWIRITPPLSISISRAIRWAGSRFQSRSMDSRSSAWFSTGLSSQG